MTVRTDGAAGAAVMKVAGAEFVLVREGNTEFYAPDPERYSENGLPTKDSPVAFAPNADVNRSVLVLFHRVNPVKTFGDVFCGVGARTLRLHREAGLEKAVLSDVNPVACRVAVLNVRREGVPAEVLCADAFAVMATRNFDAVDLDVHGSPVPYAQAAFRAVRKGFVHVTATDLASMRTRAARRKYLLDSPVAGDDWTAARAVVGAMVRLAASEDVGARPLYTLVEPGVRIRVCLECSPRRSAANEALDGLEEGFWTGPLCDEEIVLSMVEELGDLGRCWPEDLVDRVKEVLDDSLTFGTREGAVP